MEFHDKKIVHVNQYDDIKREFELYGLFIPDEMLTLSLNSFDDKHVVNGTLMYIDLSKINEYFEEFYKRYVKCFTNVSRILNAFYATIIKIIMIFDGDILRFSGTNLLAFWRKAHLRNAVNCSLTIRNLMEKMQESISNTFDVKISIATGDVCLSFMGNDLHKVLLISGQPYHDVQIAMLHIEIGEVWIVKDSWNEAQLDIFDYEVTRDGYAKLTNRRRQLYDKRYEQTLIWCEEFVNYHKVLTVDEFDEGQIDFNATCVQRNLLRNARSTINSINFRTLISKPILEMIDARCSLQFCEITETTVCYVQIIFNDSIDATDTWQKIYRNLSDLILNNSGIITNVLTFRNAIGFNVLYGQQKSHCAHNALITCNEINDYLIGCNEEIEYVFMSICQGVIFTGIIGDVTRRDYVVIGEPILKTMRLVTEFSCPIVCDYRTYKYSRMPLNYFKLLSIYDDDYVFEFYKEDEQLTTQLPLIGKENECCLFRDIVVNPKVVDGYLGVCFHGDDGLGKSKFLNDCHVWSIRNEHLALYVELSIKSHPYYCLSLLYRQLYDGSMERHGVPTDLWNFNEILQDDVDNMRNFIYKKINVINHFVDLCKRTRNGFVIVFIDNVHLIDTESLEIIETILKTNHLRLIATGRFAEEHWDVKFKLSICKHVKLLEWPTLNLSDVPVLVCQLLSVRGVPDKLTNYLFKASNGRSRTINNLLLQLINTENLLIALVDNTNDYECIYPLPKLLNSKYRNKSHPDLNKDVMAVVEMAADFDYDRLISVNYDYLFVKMSDLQKRIVRIASVIAVGKIFWRKSLLHLMKMNDTNDFVDSIGLLFEEGIFECASTKLNCKKFKKLTCICSADGDYRFCNYIYYGNVDFFFDMIDDKNEVDALRTNLIDHLERITPLCANCYCDCWYPIVRMRRYVELININLDFDEINERNLTLRTLWDTRNCNCLQILLKTYDDLIVLTDLIGDRTRKIFFLTEYAFLLMTTGEYVKSLEYLNDVELLENYIDFESDALIGTLKTRVLVLKGECQMKLSNYEDARDTLLDCLRRCMIVQTNSRLSIFGRSINVKFLYEKRPLFRTDLSRCMMLLSNLMAISKDEESDIAIYFAIKSVDFLQNSSYETYHICDAFRNLLNLYCRKGDNKTCNGIINLSRLILEKSNGRSTLDLVSFHKLLYKIFETVVLFGRTDFALNFGFKLLNLTIKNSNEHLIETISILCTIYLTKKKINEAVHLAKRIYGLKSLQNDSTLLTYYAFCLELILETSFILECPEKCTKFARHYYQINSNKIKLNDLEIKMLVLLFNYHLRNNQYPEALKWKKLINFDTFELTNNYTSTMNWFKYTESLLIIHVKSLEGLESYKKLNKNEIRYYLSKCEIVAKKWHVFLPRYLHLFAYYKQIKNSRKTKNYLKYAVKASEIQGNILEKCWIMQNKHSWNGGFNFGYDLYKIDWKLANTYLETQWSQIMYSLPYLT